MQKFMYQLSVTSTLHFKNESSTPSVTNFCVGWNCTFSALFATSFKNLILISQWASPWKTSKLRGTHFLKFQSTFGKKTHQWAQGFPISLIDTKLELYLQKRQPDMRTSKKYSKRANLSNDYPIKKLLINFLN